MSNQFTREEAVSLFGKTVECVKTRVSDWSTDEIDIISDLFKKGERAEVDCITNNHEENEILISLLVDNDWLEFDKEQFQKHCVLVN